MDEPLEHDEPEQDEPVEHDDLLALDDLLEQTARDDHAGLREALFATSDPAAIAIAIGDLVAAALEPVQGARFVHHSVGLTVGLRLADGRDVVMKVHRWHAEPARLAAVQQVQSHLADAGFPAPRPLVAPTPVGEAIATVEEHRAGGHADGHDPAVRAGLAAGLAELVRLGGELRPRPPVGRSSLLPVSPDTLWAEPHDLRFDFDATSDGAAWIDDIARAAKGQIDASGLPDVVMHLDWRVQNAGFDAAGALVAVFDWDSLGLTPEAVGVGQAAAQFSTDWDEDGLVTLPSVDEMAAFVADYEQARGTPFDEAERTAADAGARVLCAYSARCEHSERLLHPDSAVDEGEGWARLLPDLAERSLFTRGAPR